jgi:8-oxo-dGTP pyrophosphatase MutT (NUDIX family)
MDKTGRVMRVAEAKFYYRNDCAPAPNQPTSIGVVALIEHRHRLLLERRSDSARWAIIGGAMKSGESLLDCLHREVQEETGLRVRSCEMFGTFSDPSRIAAFPDGNVKRIVTIAYRVEVEPFEALSCSEESLELRFVDRAEIGALAIAETHIPIVDHYFRESRFVLE